MTETPKVITPAVGRIVWYYPFVSEMMKPGPRAAIVADVQGDRMVNLAVFDQNGVAHPRPNVRLLQPGDPIPTREAYCTWMPYQKGQAAKTEALERQLSEQPK